MTVKQRAGFETALHDALQEAKRLLSDKRDEAERSALQKVIDESGAAELVNEIRSLNQSLDEANAKLELMGFEMRDDGIRLAYDAGEELKKSYEERIAKQIAPETAKVEAIYAAQRDAWSISTLPEAKRILKSIAS
jgi:hypothetical protein